METMTRTTLTRSESIFYPNGDLPFEEALFKEALFEEAEVIFPFEVEDEARDIDATKKIIEFVYWMHSFDESFMQVMQISVPRWKSTTDDTEYATISIDKSVDLTNLYISISTTGNVYSLSIEPSLTLEAVLEYLWNDVDEFQPYRDRDYEYNFTIKNYSGNVGITTDQVLEMPIADVALSQGRLAISRISTAWWN
jgi:hypothetical protein